MNNYFVYIITNWNNKVLYVGVTNNLERRIYEHKHKLVDGFSKKYNLNKLIYYESTIDINSAISREKEIKKWRREKKDKLIESLNPDWKELSEDDKGKISQSKKQEALLRTRLTAVRNDRPEVVGLIISAGLSSRMTKFKPLLKYEGKTFLSNIIDKSLPICSEIIVVTGHNNQLIESEIKNCYLNNDLIKCVYNSDYQDGMFTSIKKGIESIKNNGWILFHQVDQPNLPQNFYFEFIEQIDNNHDWIQPQYKTKRGHPILFNQKIASMISAENAECNLREISNSLEIKKKYWQTSFSQILTDIDLPADITKLKSE